MENYHVLTEKIQIRYSLVFKKLGVQPNLFNPCHSQYLDDDYYLPYISY